MRYNEFQAHEPRECHRDTSILYMLLMLGTLWLGLFLYNFRKTPYLTRSASSFCFFFLALSSLVSRVIGHQQYKVNFLLNDLSFEQKPQIIERFASESLRSKNLLLHTFSDFFDLHLTHAYYLSRLRSIRRSRFNFWTSLGAH